MESTLDKVARFILAGLHHFLAFESTVRQGQGAFLAAGLHQPGPLDHRTLPGLSRPMGHLAAGLPLRHRQGTVCGQDQTGRGVCPAASAGNGVGRHQTLLTPRQQAPGLSLEATRHDHDRRSRSGARGPAQRISNPLSGAVDRERRGRRDSAAGRGRQSLVSTRLADDRQQNPVEHRGGDLRFLVHVRSAGRCAGVLPTTATG